uniref:Uncharacterized protein n=1 Tax=Bartonella rochalimae ATCC BAA-1498 TaxID=685782 RepID=E6YKS0_9HYPH|nr:hypothetical protein BARRO_30039 [Bartonella rochalimae ATCC BAA-1498]
MSDKQGGVYHDDIQVSRVTYKAKGHHNHKVTQLIQKSFKNLLDSNY